MFPRQPVCCLGRDHQIFVIYKKCTLQYFFLNVLAVSVTLCMIPALTRHIAIRSLRVYCVYLCKSVVSLILNPPCGFILINELCILFNADIFKCLKPGIICLYWLHYLYVENIYKSTSIYVCGDQLSHQSNQRYVLMLHNYSEQSLQDVLLKET